jgi:hypothetical protein
MGKKKHKLPAVFPRTPPRELPADFLDLPPAEQRRILVRHDAARFKAGDPDAWFDLLLRAVLADPDIPDDPYLQIGDDKPASVRTRLLARLIQTVKGKDNVDPLSKQRRAKEFAEMEIYFEVMAVGGDHNEAVQAVADQHKVSFSTIDRAYRSHLERWQDHAPRLDGRRKDGRKK